MTQENRHGKREARRSGRSSGGMWGEYRRWAAGLSRKQRRRWYTILGVALVLVTLMAALAAWIRVPKVPHPPAPPVPGGESGDVSFEGAQLPDVALSGRKEGVYTFLVVGKDVASGSTDTILLLSYNTEEKSIQGLNIPRDTMANVSTASKRINAVYSYNKGRDKATQVEKGMTALKNEVKKLTGVLPDFYIMVEWEAVGKLVEALNGVEFEVPFDMNYDDPYQDLHIHQKAGLRTLNGDDAMQVIRWRKNNTGPSGGDVARLKIQQEFLKAVANKCLQPSTFLKIPSLVQIFMDSVTTDLTVGNILAFAQMAYGMDPETGVSFSTAPLADSFMFRRAALVTLDVDKTLEVINGGMNPYLRDIERRDVEVLIRNSDGSFRVTTGTLADESMAKPAPVPKPEPEQPEEPVDPETPVDPDNPVDPNAPVIPTDPETPVDPTAPVDPQSPTDPQTPVDPQPQQPGGGELPDVEIDPGEIFPEPDSPVGQDVPRDVGGSAAPPAAA